MNRCAERWYARERPDQDSVGGTLHRDSGLGGSGQFTLRLQDLDERQRAARDLGYRYSYRILASAVTVLLAVALQLPADRLLGATNRLAWLAVAIVVVQFMWMLPTMIVGGMEPDPPRRG